MRRGRCSVGLLAAALAGCSAVGPDYRRPPAAIVDAPSAQGAFVGADEALFARGAVPGAWWRLYRDPLLDALVQDSLRANTDLRVAAGNLARSRAGLEQADAARDPATSLAFAPSYARRSAEEEILGTNPLPNNWTYGLTAGVSYQVDLFGQISRAIEAASGDVASAQAAYDAARVTVAAETTRAYLESCSAGREMRIARQLVDVQTRGIALTERLQRSGRAIALDVIRSSGQEDQVRATLPALDARKQLAVYRLATLAGRPPSERSLPALQCDMEPQLAETIPVGDGEALLRRRPDIRRAESELRAATARIGVAEADLYPKVSLGASMGSIGLASDALNAGTLKFSLGPLITWQFPDRSRTRARIKAAQADETVAYARFDGAVVAALREVESALVVYARDLDARVLLEAARRKSARAATDTDRLFAAGRVAYLSVLDATRTLTASAQAVAAADSRLAADQVALFLALGGGWQADAVAEPGK